jgi:excisionase family DNA binding protein
VNLDTALRDLVREIIRDEIRPLQEQLRFVIEVAAKGRPANESAEGAYLTVEQVAATMNVTEATVRTWIKSGALTASRPSAGEKVGRVYRVCRADLDAFTAGARSPIAQEHEDIKAEAANIVTLATHRRKL